LNRDDIVPAGANLRLLFGTSTILSTFALILARSLDFLKLVKLARMVLFGHAQIIRALASQSVVGLIINRLRRPASVDRARVLAAQPPLRRLF